MNNFFEGKTIAVINDNPDRTVTISLSDLNQIKSKTTIGNFVLYNTNHYNWFQKNMIKFCFGFVVEYYGDNK